MPVVSIRFSDLPLHQRLKDGAQCRQVAISTLAEQLIDEGLRMDAHPAIVFRDGPTGRRAAIAGGPDVAEVIASIIGGDVGVDERRARASDLMGLSLHLVDAALAYYADHTDEIDEEIAARIEAASLAEAAWRHQRLLLAK